MGISVANYTALRSPSWVFQRFMQEVKGVQGDIFFATPSTADVTIANKAITPAAGNDGLTPYSCVPIDTALTKPTTNRGDCIVLMVPGTYTLAANVILTQNHMSIIAPSWIRPEQVSIVGVAGGPPLQFRGLNVSVRGFSVESGDAAYASMVASGRYFTASKMRFDSNGSVTPLYGLYLQNRDATDIDASDAIVEDCTFADNDTHIRLGSSSTVSIPGPTGVKIRRNLLQNAVTRHISQDTGDGHYLGEDLYVYENQFAKMGGTEYIRLANDNNVGMRFLDNVFAHAAISATEVVMTAGGFIFAGNRDKQGFITTI